MVGFICVLVQLLMVKKNKLVYLRLKNNVRPTNDVKNWCDKIGSKIPCVKIILFLFRYTIAKVLELFFPWMKVVCNRDVSDNCSRVISVVEKEVLTVLDLSKTPMWRESINIYCSK